MKTPLLFPLILYFFFLFSCSYQPNEISKEVKNDVDTYLTKAIELHNIPGIALAVIVDGKVAYKNYQGYSSIENKTPVNKNTIFRVFSTTKLITTVGIFQLIENEKLSLNDKISTFIDNLPAQWHDVRVKHLLSHSSGLPDIIRYESTLNDQELMTELVKEEMHFITGNEFRYNQTNYWFLALIIEKVSGVPFEEYILKNQFNNSTDGILFSSNSKELIPNRATRYFYNGRINAFDSDSTNNGSRGHSGNGLNITLNTFIQWNEQLDRGELLTDQTKTKMWTPFTFANTGNNFLHGWGSYRINEANSYGFSGGNLAAFRKFEEEKTTIILLSNGYKIPAYDIIVNDIARLIIPEFRTKNLTLEQDIMGYVLENKLDDKAIESYHKLRKENPDFDFENLKWNINGIGNSHLYVENDNESALQVFKFNAQVNSDWWVSLASLAEMYEIKKDSVSAVENFKKAIILNKNNQWDYNDLMEEKVDELTNGTL